MIPSAPHPQTSDRWPWTEGFARSIPKNGIDNAQHDPRKCIKRHNTPGNVVVDLKLASRKGCRLPDFREKSGTINSSLSFCTASSTHALIASTDTFVTDNPHGNSTAPRQHQHMIVCAGEGDHIGQPITVRVPINACRHGNGPVGIVIGGPGPDSQDRLT